MARDWGLRRRLCRWTDAKSDSWKLQLKIRTVTAMAKQIEPGVMCMCLVCPTFYFQSLGSWGTAKSWGRGTFDLTPLDALLGKTAILSGFFRSSLRGLQRTSKPNPWLSPGWFEAASQKNWERQRGRDTWLLRGQLSYLPTRDWLLHQPALVMTTLS